MNKETPKHQLPDAPLAPGYKSSDHHAIEAGRVTQGDLVKAIESRFHGIAGTQDDNADASERTGNSEPRKDGDVGNNDERTADRAGRRK